MATTPVSSPLPEHARDATGAALQATLVELIELSLVAKQAHWNVVGQNFRSAHLQLDELVSAARGFADEVAERASAIGVSPDGRAATIAQTARATDAYPAGWQTVETTRDAVVDLLATIIERLRERIAETDKTDPVSQDLLIGITASLEQAHWMWQAQQAS